MQCNQGIPWCNLIFDRTGLYVNIISLRRTLCLYLNNIIRSLWRLCHKLRHLVHIYWRVIYLKQGGAFKTRIVVSWLLPSHHSKSKTNPIAKVVFHKLCAEQPKPSLPISSSGPRNKQDPSQVVFHRIGYQCWNETSISIQILAS